MLVPFVMRAQPDVAPPSGLRPNRPRDDIRDVIVPAVQDKRSNARLAR